MDLQNGITIFAILLGGAGLTGMWRASRTLIKLTRELLEGMGAIKEVAIAQLSANGGGSLVDKANKIPDLEEAVATLTKTVNANDQKAETNWQGLRDNAEEIKDRLAQRESRIDEVLAALKGGPA